jgi:hypothetical protein
MTTEEREAAQVRSLIQRWQEEHTPRATIRRQLAAMNARNRDTFEKVLAGMTAGENAAGFLVQMDPPAGHA